MAEDTKAMPIMQAFYTRPPVQAKKPKSQDPRASSTVREKSSGI